MREGLSSVPEEITTSQGKQVRDFFFFFFFKYMYIQHIYIMYIFNTILFTICTYLHIYKHLLTSGPGGAPVGQPLQVPGGIALSQPRQHPSNTTE